MLTRVWQGLEYRIDVCTHRTSLVVKKKISFPVAVNNSITVGPLVLLLLMFVITENIMKRPVYGNSTGYSSDLHEKRRVPC